VGRICRKRRFQVWNEKESGSAGYHEHYFSDSTYYNYTPCKRSSLLFSTQHIHSLQHDTRQAKLAQRPLESLGTVQRRGERYDGTSIRTGPLQSKKIKNRTER